MHFLQTAFILMSSNQEKKTTKHKISCYFLKLNQFLNSFDTFGKPSLLLQKNFQEFVSVLFSLQLTHEDCCCCCRCLRRVGSDPVEISTGTGVDRRISLKATSERSRNAPGCYACHADTTVVTVQRTAAVALSDSSHSTYSYDFFD